MLQSFSFALAPGSRHLFTELLVLVIATEIGELPPLNLSAIIFKVIGCSSLRGGRGELGTNKNLDLWLQLVCTKFKLFHTI